jgi:hypothetical protein
VVSGLDEIPDAEEEKQRKKSRLTFNTAYVHWLNLGRMTKLPKRHSG